MTWHHNPWTNFQKSLVAIAIVLALCCMMTEMVMELRPYMNGQKPQTSALNLFVPSH
jgi:hypothetical protein